MPNLETPPTTAPPRRRRRLLLILLAILALPFVILLAVTLRNYNLNSTLDRYEQHGGLIRRAAVTPISQLVYWIKNEYHQRRTTDWWVDDNWREELQNTGDVVILQDAPLNPEEFWIIPRLSLHTLQLPRTPLSPELIAAVSHLNQPINIKLPDSEATDQSLAELCKALANHHDFLGLELGRTTITNAGAKVLKNISGLWMLGLESPNIDGNILQILASTPLSSLKLAGCNITDQDIPTLIQNFPSLRFLDLSRTKLTSKGIAQLTGLSIYTLSLEDLPVTDDLLASLAKLRLGELSLARTQITDAGILHLGKRKTRALYHLNLSGTKITVAALQTFLKPDSQQPSLALILADTNFDDSSFESFYKITQLTELDLSGSKITDRFLDRLNSSGLSELRTLNIKRTNTTSTPIPALKKAHPKLRILTDHGTY